MVYYIHLKIRKETNTACLMEFGILPLLHSAIESTIFNTQWKLSVLLYVGIIQGLFYGMMCPDNFLLTLEVGVSNINKWLTLV